MQYPTKPHLWRVAVAILALLAFSAGTSLACFHKGVGPVQVAEDCCQRHCQHAMMGTMADQCCQSHRARVAQVLPTVSPAKAAAFVAQTLQVAVILPVILPSPTRSWIRPTEERPPPFPSLYALHCTLLI